LSFDFLFEKIEMKLSNDQLDIRNYCSLKSNVMKSNVIGVLTCFLLMVYFTSIISCNKDEPDPNIVTDICGNEYTKVQIGTQVWMGENLNCSKLNDGTDISYVEDRIEWTTQQNNPAYCYHIFGENSSEETYGAHYNWYAVNTGKLCPKGWHVPSEADWRTLADFLGGKEIAGGKMKEIEYAHWEEPNKGATDESGFTALPSGYRDANDGFFKEINKGGSWWGSSYYSDTEAWGRVVRFNETDLFSFHAPKLGGNCIRCIQD
jgi:uncharacterized protein (TIGR02145 family)